jgi:hypothetical protein
MTFVSYRKTQRTDEECKKFCKCWKNWMGKKTYNSPNQSKTISTCYQKKLDPISRGHDSYIYYMIKLYLYTMYHNQLYMMKSI